MFFVLNGIGLAIQLACIGFTYYLFGLTDKFCLQRGADHRDRARHAVPVLVVPQVGVGRAACGRRPGPRAPAAAGPPVAGPPLAARRRPGSMPGQNGDGHAPDLLHANGHGATARARLPARPARPPTAGTARDALHSRAGGCPAPPLCTLRG